MPGLLDFAFNPNQHGAMGLFGDRPALLIALALAVLALLGYLLRDVVRASPLAQVGFGLVAGGAIGNMWDRLIHGFVVDFIAPRAFYVFNIADACISVGMAFIIAAAMRKPATS